MQQLICLYFVNYIFLASSAIKIYIYISIYSIFKVIKMSPYSHQVQYNNNMKVLLHHVRVMYVISIDIKPIMLKCAKYHVSK